MRIRLTKNREKESSWQRGWLFLFIAGLCLGILFANMFGKQFLSDVGIISAYMLDKFSSTSLDNGRFAAYCMKKRLLPFVYISAFGLTMFGLAVIGIYIVWLGFSLGVLVSVSVMRFGAGGLLLVVGALLPQYIVYVPAFLGLMRRAGEICTQLYYPRYSIPEYGGKKQQLLRYALSVLVLLLVCIMGVMLESYVNPPVLKKILQFF